MTPLVIGAVVSLVTLAWVLAPLIERRVANVAPATDAVPTRTMPEYGALPVVCARCGVRPERDAIYCSTCGAPVNPPRAPEEQR
jgi:hypothetical protein